MMNEVDIDRLRLLVSAHGIPDVLIQLSRLAEDEARGCKPGSGKAGRASEEARAIMSVATALRRD